MPKATVSTLAPESATDGWTVQPVLRTATLSCRLTADGRLELAAEGAADVHISGAAPRVSGRRAGQAFTWVAAPLRAAGEGRYVAESSELALRVDLRCTRREDGAWELGLGLENQGAEAVHIEELAPLYVGSDGQVRIGAGTDRWSVLRNGFQSWSGTRAFLPEETDVDPYGEFLRLCHTDVRHRAAGRAGVVRSDLVTAIKNLRSGEVLCLGFTGSRRAFGAIAVDARVDKRPELLAACDFDGIALAAGERLECEPLWVGAGFDEHALLAACAQALGTAMQARVDDRSPIGWCSWYYYFTRVTEADVLQNLEALAALRNRLPCDYVMIDDGWQPAIGDWSESNAKFPHGMPWLASQIEAAGFYAGLWLAPFIARPESQLYRQHPDWFVRTAGGRPRPAIWNPLWGLRHSAYALDTTHPEVLDWLRQLGRTLVQDWNYRVLKLDFLFAASLPGVRHDATATRAQALRRGLEAFREGAGDDVFLLGCGCPLGPAVGVVDGMRIGPDVTPYWRNWLSRSLLRGRHGIATEHALRSTLTRAYMHRRLWLNDPDCLIVRGDRTRLTAPEVQSLAATIGLSDGMFVISERMDLLPEDRLALLENALSLTRGKATVIDLCASGMPELLLCEGRDGRRLCVFNFRDQAVRKAVDVGRFGVRGGELHEQWSGRRLPVRDGWVQLDEIAPHGNALLRLD